MSNPRTTRRIVVGKGEDGTSVIVADDDAPVVHVTDAFNVTEIWSSDGTVTQSTTDPTPERTEIDLELANGTTRFRVVDFPPAGAVEPFMHATPTIDYLVVLEGTLRLHLDTGEAIDIAPGDTAVLLGNVHAWEPLGNGCRMAFVNLGADPA